MSVSAEATPTPFKGLSAFQDTELDALLFYGREREREIVVANLLASRLTVLYGASGVGKTSLLRAAVAQSIREAHDAAVIVFSSWAGDPRDGLAAAIDAAVGIESKGTLTERLRAASEAVGGDVYVILDQFEEYFLYHEDDPFAAELAAAISEPGLRANFLLGLREDALAKLDAFKGRIPNLFGNYLRLDHLDRGGARSAILGPVERYNELTGTTVHAEPQLVEAVLDEVAAGRVDAGRAGRGGVEADAERVEAPYLQLVLERLWEAERDRGSDVLRLSTLRELGGAEAIVRAHLERALGRLEPSEQDVAATMFAHLVTPSGSKIAHRPGDLAQYAAVPEADVKPVLDALGRERIVRAVDGAAGGERYEIFHDVLADGVLAWRARRELERDREQARTRQRRLAIVAAAALLALAVMTAVAVYAFAERSHARSSARQARARALEATALAELPTDPQRALADAARAAQGSPSSRAAEVLRRALRETHLRRVLKAAGPVTAVSFGHGGRMLAASAGGNRIYSADGMVEQTLPAGDKQVRGLSPDGRLAATVGGKLDQVSVFDTRSGRLLHVLAPHGVRSARFSPDGKLLATADYRGTDLWSPRTGRHVGVLADPGKPKRMNDSEFSPDGSMLAAAGDDGAVRVWDVARRERLFYFASHTSSVVAVAWSPDGRFVADASSDGTADVFAVEGFDIGRQVASLVGHSAAVSSVAYSPDGSSILTGSADGTARLWDARFEQDLRPLAGLQKGGAVTAAFDSRGRLAVSAGADGTVRIWEVRTRRLLRTLLQPGPVNDARLSPDGRLVVTAGSDGSARIWDTGTGEVVRRLRAHAQVLVTRFSPDGAVVAIGDGRGVVRLMLARNGRVRGTGRQRGPVSDAVFAPDGKSLATAGREGASVWSLAGRLRRLFRSPGASTRVAFSPNGSLVAAAGDDGAARIWNVARGGLRDTLRVSKLPLTDVVFSPDGRLLLTTGLASTVQTWDVRTGALLHVLIGHFGTVSGGAFSPDGHWIVTAGPSNAGLWQRNAGQPYFYLRGDTGALTSVAFSPDGRLVLSSSLDGSVRLYRCEVCGNLDALERLATRRLAEVQGR